MLLDLVVLAILVSSLAAPITIGAVVLAILAASILILAIAMLLGALAIKMFIDAIMSMDPVKFAANIGVLGASLFAIIPAIFAFAAALGILGLALVGFVLAAVPGLIGLIGVAVAVGIFGLALAWLNGILTGIVGNFTALQGALVTLTQLGTNLPIIADSLSKLGDALKSSSEKFAPFVNSFSVLSGMIGPLLLLSLVMGNLAESVAKMGNGMQMFSNNIAAVMKGLSDMVTFVKANGSNFAENFATQIDKVSQSFAKMAAISPLIALTGMISGVSNNNNNVQAQANPGAQDLTPIIKEVQEMNAKLTDIRDNTKGTVDKLTELIRITRSGSAWQPTMTTGKS